MIGWILGDMVASSFVHGRLRVVAEARDENTFPGILANWFGQEYRLLRPVCIAFLGA